MLVEQLLQGTGLDEAGLESPELEISENQHIQILHNLIKLTNDPGIGLTVGLGRFISSLDRFGYAMISCATFRESLEVGIKFQRVVGRFCGRQLIMSFFVEGDTAVIQINDDPALGELRIFAIEEMFGCILGQTKWVTGKSLKIKSVHCSYGPRSYADIYQNVFQCPIFFDSPHNQIRFSKSILDTPLPQACSHSASMYKAYCEELAVQLDQAEDDFVEKVRRVIMSHPKLSPGSDEVATNLSMSERTFRRKLSEKGFSYHHLVDDVREGIAKNYLTTSNRSVEDIAFMIGFSDPTSFSRAFKRWTGQSPRQYRNVQ